MRYVHEFDFFPEAADTTIAVLGGTGSVGQRFILLLALHPHFKLHAIGASSRSAGKKYKDAVRWKQNVPMSKELGDLVVKECKAEDFLDCDLVFSGLDSDVAGDIGMPLTATDIYEDTANLCCLP